MKLIRDPAEGLAKFVFGYVNSSNNKNGSDVNRLVVVYLEAVYDGAMAACLAVALRIALVGATPFSLLLLVGSIWALQVAGESILVRVGTGSLFSSKPDPMISVGRFVIHYGNYWKFLI